MATFRELSGEEQAIASGEGDPIVITGTRLTRYFNSMNATYLWSSDSYSDPGSSSQPEEVVNCTCGMHMDAKAQLASLVNQEATSVLSAILAKSDQNMEYGSAIYFDANGLLTHTPLVPSSTFTTQLEFSGIPKNADGTTDFSRILAVVHSHPRYLPNEDGSPGYTEYYDPNDPDYLLYPSNREDMPDDWDFFNQMSGFIAGDGGDPSMFSMIIAGYNGSTLELNKYFGGDAQTTSADAGEPIEPDYESPVYGCPVHGG